MLLAILEFMREHWVMTAILGAAGGIFAEHVRRENAKADQIRLRNRANGQNH